LELNNEFSLDDLYKEAYELNTPISVTMELLSECNWRCKHCYIPEHTNSGFSTIKVINILHDLRNLGVLNLTFTGGEVFMRDDIFEILQVARNLHFRVSIFSNASLLNKEKIEKLVKLNISQVSVSLFSMDSYIHDEITGVNGSHSKAISNIEMMITNGVDVLIKTPLMEINKFCYIDINNYCREKNIKYTASTTIFAKSDGDDSTHSLKINGYDLIKVIRDVDDINNESLSTFKFDYDEPCAAIFYSFSIDALGDVYPCNSLFLKVGNVFESSISEIWNHSDELAKLKAIKKSDLRVCNNCKLIDKCYRCPGLALLEDGDLKGCSTAAKETAVARFSFKELAETNGVLVSNN
jgi:radical SAM protein with 4Fe4S-binding SPASM domain